MRHQSINKIFSLEGPLAKKLPGYELRTEQVTACNAIDEAFRTGRHCLVEAGTGVGKSLAYLIPAVRAAANGEKTVIATHTINLQTQLIMKDIPLVASLFPEVKIKAVLMKGRGNYLCHQEMDYAANDLFLTMDTEFNKLKSWSQTSETGDLADLPFTFKHWGEVGSNQDTCHARECAYFDRCFYFKMIKEAADANIIVVNHALFLCDLEMKEQEAERPLIPPYDHVVFDEAHHLENVATGIFGVDLGQKDIPRFIERMRRVKGAEINVERLDELEALNSSLFIPFEEARYEYFLKDVLNEDSDAMMKNTVSQMKLQLEMLEKELLQSVKDTPPPINERLQGFARQTARLRESLHLLVFEEDEDYIRWGDSSVAQPRAGRQRDSAPRVNLHWTPINVGKRMKQLLWDLVPSVTLTSATLSNSGGFSYLRSRLSIPEEVIETVVGSPFEFNKQAMLYVPGHLPEPPKGANDDYTEGMAEEIMRIVDLTEGRAFLLFTSKRMMNDIYERLQMKLKYPLFRQGDQPPGKLLDEFRSSGNGCLLGVQTFWEGVDVRGDALSCVIIDRLPFAVPDSPVTRARTDAITAAGGDWFNEFSVPQAQIRLKQGFGRLIRTHTDIGIVCIMDTRLITKRYGKEFVKYLPPASRASLWPRVEKWWNEMQEAGTRNE